MAIRLSLFSAFLTSLSTCLSLPADFCLTSASTSCCSCPSLCPLPRPRPPAPPRHHLAFSPSLPHGVSCCPSPLCPGRLGPGEASGPCSLSWMHRGPSEWAAVCPLLVSGSVCLLPAHDGLVRGGGHPTLHPASGAPTAGGGCPQLALRPLTHCNPLCGQAAPDPSLHGGCRDAVSLWDAVTLQLLARSPLLETPGALGWGGEAGGCPGPLCPRPCSDRLQVGPGVGRAGTGAKEANPRGFLGAHAGASLKRLWALVPA